MKGLTGCLGLLIGVPLALVLLYFVGGALLFLLYALFHIFLYFLPLLVLAAIVIFFLMLAYHIWAALNR